MIRVLSQISPNIKTINSSKLTLKNLHSFLTPKKMGTPIFNFAKKRPKLQLEVTSISMSKFKQEHQGFLLYQNKEGIKMKAISIAFAICFLSGYWTYTKIEDDQIKINYLIMGAAMAVSFFIFQIRTGKSLKRMVLDKTGQSIVLTRFQLGGFGEEATKTKVEVLKGIGKGFLFGGNVIKGGGVYGLEQRNYWFQSKYILERDVFEEVVEGRRVKVQKYTSSL